MSQTRTWSCLVLFIGCLWGCSNAGDAEVSDMMMATDSPNSLEMDVDSGTNDMNQDLSDSDVGQSNNANNANTNNGNNGNNGNNNNVDPTITDEICYGLDVVECADAGCKPVDGRRLNRARNCYAQERTYVGCRVPSGGNNLVRVVRNINTDECFMVGGDTEIPSGDEWELIPRFGAEDVCEGASICE